MRRRKLWQSAVAQIVARKWSGVEPPEAAAQLARSLRGQREPFTAVDLTPICQAFGLELEERPLRVDALLQETEKGFVAVLNSSTNRGRRRFSIAHELGHVALYKSVGLREAFGHGARGEDRNSEAAEVEQLCDDFASELLMPMDEWRTVAFDDGVSVEVVRRAAARYKVSIAAAARRLVQAEIWRCAAAIWTPVLINGRLTELKPVQFAANIRFGTGNWPRAFPDKEELCTPGSPLYAFHQRIDTTGEVLLPFDGCGERYLCQSGVLGGHTPQVLTIIVTERYGLGVLSRTPTRIAYSGGERDQLAAMADAGDAVDTE